MKRQEDFTMSEWRDYYEAKAKKAEYNFQSTGDPRYDRELIKYEAIVDAFNGYLENKNETDDAKRRRQRNIDAYMEQHLYKDELYTRAEVKRFFNAIREF